MIEICNSCSGTGCSKYGPPPGNRSYGCSSCGGSGEIDDGHERYEATVTIDIEIERGSDADYVKQIALERLYDELESEAISLTLLE